MKKTIVAAALFPILALVPPGPAAFAGEEVQPGLEINVDARFRAVYRDNFDFGNHTRNYGHPQKYTDSRVRVQFKATTPGGAYALGRLYVGSGRNENNDTDSGATASGGAENIWVDRAFIMAPLGDHVKLQLGKERVTYGTNFFYNDLPSGGVRAFIELGPVELNPFVEWLSEGQNELPSDRYWDHDAIRYGLHLGAKLGDNWRVGALAAYQTDDRDWDGGLDANGERIRFSDHKGWLAALYFDGKEGAFGLKGEAAYNDRKVAGFNQWWDDHHSNGGDGYPNAKEDGFGAYIQPSYTWDALTLGLNLGFTHGGLIAAPEFGFLMMGGDQPITPMSVGEHGDWLWAGLIARYAVSDDVSITGNLAYAHVHGDGREKMESLEGALEVSGVLSWAITKHVTFNWYAGVLIPSFDDPTYDDTAAFGSMGRFMFRF